MSEAAAAEATLELTLLTPDTLKSVDPTAAFLLGKLRLKLKLIAWVDPAPKRSPKTLTLTLDATRSAAAGAAAPLHLPLSSHLLRNPNSSLTVQILSPRRFPFRPSLLLASASLPLSSLPLLAADPLALPLLLRRPRSGGASLRVAVRVLWPLGPAPDGSPAELASGAAEFVRIEPSAPPMPPQPPGAAEDGAWRSFLVGLASGAIAAAVVGVLGLGEI